MQAKIDLKLDNVEVINQRVEDYRPMEDGHRIYFDVITARAYATTDDILSSTSHLQNEDTSILVMQGKRDEQIHSDQYELVESHTLDIFGLDAERHLLEIKKI
jgi:16S rRNA (guanine527-N7)-methyltransferase